MATPRDLDDLLTPALLVDLDAVRGNVRRTLEIVGEPSRWRPHVKTAKLPQVLAVLLDAGVRRFKCATTKEARCTLEAAERRGVVVDLLVAMALRGANLDAIAELRAAHRDHAVAVLTEDPAHAAAVRARDEELGLFVDLDPGYHRTGIPLEDRDRLAATIDAAGPALWGLHFYDGHLHRGIDSDERARECERLYGSLVALARELRLDDLELVTSGTPTFSHAIAFAPFSGLDHTVSPGTVVYWDETSETFGIEGYRSAVHVLARVISTPGGGRVTCDAGSKSIDAAAGDPCCRVVDWPGLCALRPSEEHLPLAVLHGRAPAPGTLLRLVPRHVCPTVNLADHAVLVTGGQIRAIVPVAARGHDTVRGVDAPR
jgi:D-serine deaminase-like pyridoxal phosphate-dependent protein